MTIFSPFIAEMELITRRVIVELEGKEPDRETLMAYTDPDHPKYAAMVEKIREKLGFTSLAYLRLDDMLASTGVDTEQLCPLRLIREGIEWTLRHLRIMR